MTRFTKNKTNTFYICHVTEVLHLAKRKERKRKKEKKRKNRNEMFKVITYLIR